jgi:hypothetical protein
MTRFVIFALFFCAALLTGVARSEVWRHQHARSGSSLEQSELWLWAGGAEWLASDPTVPAVAQGGRRAEGEGPTGGISTDTRRAETVPAGSEQRFTIDGTATEAAWACPIIRESDKSRRSCLSPSLGTPGEGWGGGSSTAAAPAEITHPPFRRPPQSSPRVRGEEAEKDLPDFRAQSVPRASRNHCVQSM